MFAQLTRQIWVLSDRTHDGVAAKNLVRVNRMPEVRALATLAFKKDEETLDVRKVADHLQMAFGPTNARRIICEAARVAQLPKLNPAARFETMAVNQRARELITAIAFQAESVLRRRVESHTALRRINAGLANGDSNLKPAEPMGRKVLKALKLAV